MRSRSHRLKEFVSLMRGMMESGILTAIFGQGELSAGLDTGWDGGVEHGCCDVCVGGGRGDGGDGGGEEE